MITGPTYLYHLNRLRELTLAIE